VILAKGPSIGSTGTIIKTDFRLGSYGEEGVPACYVEFDNALDLIAVAVDDMQLVENHEAVSDQLANVVDFVWSIKADSSK
jgi:hypothetical protein